MASPRNQKSAIWALAVSGGLWAWQNREKITSWLNQQKGQLQQSTGQFGTPSQPTTGSYTGATRRIDERELPSGTSFPGISSDARDTTL